MTSRRWSAVAGLCAAIAAAVLPLAAFAAPASDVGGVRFDSAGVLDLAERAQSLAGGVPAKMIELDAGDAESIFAAPALGEDVPQIAFSDAVFGCAKPARACSQAHERERIAASAGFARRDGRRLTIAVPGAAPLEFVDWKQAETPSADGDSETHWYLGRMAGNGYERVEVEFGHDAPGSFLINPRTGKVAYVHNINDIAAPSPDGMLLVTFNALNAPLSLRVAALDGAGPRLVAVCAAPDRGTRLTPVFKGWRGAAAFDVVIEVGEQSKSMARLAARISASAAGWQVAASSPGRAEQIGFACQAAASARVTP